MKLKLRHILFVFIILGLIWRAFIMQDMYFLSWDEGIYAEVTDEILRHKTLDTTFNNQTWLNKPPLVQIMLAAVFALVENRELWARMLMVAISSTFLILTYQLTRRGLLHFFKKDFKKMPAWEQDLVPMLPVFLTASTILFLERSTFINTDILLGIGWLGYFLMRESYPQRLFWVTFGTTAKSFLGLYPLGFEILQLKKSSFTQKGFLRGLGLVTIPLVWHAYAYINHGSYFVKAHVLDQMVKRVTDPIELHFGGKLFYPELAWANFNVFIILIGVAYAVIAWHLWKDIRKKGLVKVIHGKDWYEYLILLSALPFFSFLMIVQSKISWYFATILPLLALPIAYLYMKIERKSLKVLMIASILVFFLYRFLPQTYAFNLNEYEPSERTQLGLCIQDLPHDEVAFLVNSQERLNRNTLEAAQQQTETSFIYGGSAAFVYYTFKDITFYYDPLKFKDEFRDFDLVVLYTDDKESEELNTVKSVLETYTPAVNCSIGKWEVYVK